ncbi:MULTISPECIES: hypothetical protein [Cyanophyceae]|uniref:GLTT repeat-containing protein n=1 Tax=Aphanothece cf. minutissima CCALA 015 TaxID=2107695 RepID=A0ABX5FC11_9CHRO|nr:MULTISPECIES: hypothetical protein [Cyanophyceae]MCP9797754.1 hypothetical protein [Cyanobium sp. Lug-B]PSB39331.1 hypothetical protein C7B81_01400 [Aphanothece cf. minutissima CCALA 015]
MPDPVAPENPTTGGAPPSSGPSACGGRPKIVAIGIAPLGIISIGIVPMGVISIGVVPMGVLSLGAVAMGVINASVVGMGILIAGVNVMGVWWVGMEGMGPYRLGSPSGQVHHHHNHSSGQGQPNLYAYPSREEALRKARELGCEGAHSMGSLWMPCEEHPGP